LSGFSVAESNQNRLFGIEYLQVNILKINDHLNKNKKKKKIFGSNRKFVLPLQRF
jgi:hypothetical protein